MFMRWAVIPLDDELVESFFALASAEQAAHTISFIGRSASDETNQPIEPETVELLKAIWARLRELSAARADGAEVLAAFVDWFAADVFDDDWANADTTCRDRIGCHAVA